MTQEEIEELVLQLNKIGVRAWLGCVQWCCVDRQAGRRQQLADRQMCVCKAHHGVLRAYGH